VIVCRFHSQKTLKKISRNRLPQVWKLRPNRRLQPIDDDVPPEWNGRLSNRQSFHHCSRIPMDGYPNVCGGDFWQQTETRNNKRMLHKQVTQEKGSLTRCGKMCEKVEQAQLARIQEGWEIDLAMPLRDHNAFARRNHRPAFGLAWWINWTGAGSNRRHLDFQTPRAGFVSARSNHHLRQYTRLFPRLQAVAKKCGLFQGFAVVTGRKSGRLPLCFWRTIST